jgi:hypothetical protein
MKNILTLLFLLSAFNSNAQRTLFGVNNNYVAPVGPPSLVSDLVLDLDAGNSASYAGTGPTWTDLSGKGNHGTLTNGALYNSGNGGSIVFDGIDDVISFGNILNMGLSSWTISCWAKFDGGSGLMGIIGKTSYRSYEGRYSIYIDDNNLVAFFQPGLSSMIISTPLTPYLDNKFHNLTLTINRSSMMYLYVDGVTVGTPVDVSSTSAMSPNSSDKFYIGSYASSDGQSPLYFYKGNIGQALIYNRALTPQEVTANFNVLKSRFGL